MTAGDVCEQRDQARLLCGGKVAEEFAVVLVGEGGEVWHELGAFGGERNGLIAAVGGLPIILCYALTGLILVASTNCTSVLPRSAALRSHNFGAVREIRIGNV